MTSQEISRREAAEVYRGMRDRLGKSVFRTDLKRHPRIARQEAKRAQAERVPAKGPPVPAREMPPVEKPRAPTIAEIEEEEEWAGSEDEAIYAG